MSYPVLDIAYKIIARANEDAEWGGGVSNLKLQKLLYYMQGFHLAFFDEPLFNENIEAWQYGPVVPEIYHRFKQCGNSNISLAADAQIVSLTEDEEDIFKQVYDSYAQFSALKLMQMTHDETPWKTTPKERDSVIDQNKIKSFFSTLIE